jgi:thiamine pyrophosphate-dependent acetolactate synthase large subunit-like protein
LPLLCIVSLNGDWAADPNHSTPGRDLGHTEYDKMAETLRCNAEYVEKPKDARPAGKRAQNKVDEGQLRDLSRTARER